MKDFIKVMVECPFGCYELYININSIITFGKGHNKYNCTIELSNNQVMWIKQTPQEIEKLIIESQKGE